MINLKCPFCLEEDFDFIGLKHHLLSGSCEIFNNVRTLKAPSEKIEADVPLENQH